MREESEALMYTLNKVNNLEDDTVGSNIELLDEKFNKFKDSVRVTYMALQGEANVAASKCTQEVRIVSKYFFCKNLTVHDLPSTSSALNIMNEGNHIAKHQIVDSV